MVLRYETQTNEIETMLHAPDKTNTRKCNQSRTTQILVCDLKLSSYLDLPKALLADEAECFIRPTRKSPPNFKLKYETTSDLV